MKRRPITCLLLLLPLYACRPAPPPTERPPEPQAARATELRDAIRAPQDKARSVEETTRKAAEDTRAAIDAAERQ
ncbi:hypothetical protein [Pseudoxanthomonas beigongshangi]